MTSERDRLAERLRVPAQADRWDTAVVLEAVDAGHVLVDMGDSSRVARLAAGVSVAVGQSVEVTVSGRVTTVRGPLDGTGWITTGFTPAAGWTVDYAAYRMHGQLVELQVEARPSTSKTFGSNGDIANETVLTVPSTIRPPRSLPVSAYGYVAIPALVLDTDGVLELRAGTPSASTNSVVVHAVYSIKENRCA